MDNLTPAQRRKNMQNIRSIGTAVELKIAKELRRNKIYFASNVKSLPGKPDIVFRRKRIAIFIDSDFWHGHKTRCIMPTSNSAYWDEKIRKNKNRDKRVNGILKEAGWQVIRIWEYDVKKRFDKTVNKILTAGKFSR